MDNSSMRCFLSQNIDQPAYPHHTFLDYHKGIREQLLLNETSYNGEVLDIPGLIYDGTGDDAKDNVRAVIAQLTANEYIDLLFLNIILNDYFLNFIQGNDFQCRKQKRFTMASISFLFLKSNYNKNGKHN